MRQILFQIPLDQPWDLGPLGKVPGFGFGIVLLAWVLYGAWALYRAYRAGTLKLQGSMPTVLEWLAIAAVIAFGAPAFGRYLHEHGSDAFRDGLPVFGWGLMLTIGIIAATYLAAYRAELAGVNGDIMWTMVLWLITPGILGGRLFFLIQYGDEIFQGLSISEWPMAALNLSQGGMVLFGALIGGAAGYFSFCYFHRIRPLALSDIVVPSVFVGVGFGRIGCFLNGCCYGSVTSLPWGVQFPKSSATFASLVQKKMIDISASCTPPLHPTQIYSAIDGFVIAAITTWYFWHRRRNGEVLAVALVIYPITRFCMELIRADEVGQLGTSLTIAQWISIGLFLVNIPYMIYLSRLPAVREPIVLPSNLVNPPPTSVASHAR